MTASRVKDLLCHKCNHAVKYHTNEPHRYSDGSTCAVAAAVSTPDCKCGLWREEIYIPHVAALEAKVEGLEATAQVATRRELALSDAYLALEKQIPELQQQLANERVRHSNCGEATAAVYEKALGAERERRESAERVIRAFREHFDGTLQDNPDDVSCCKDLPKQHFEKWGGE